jgi:hypothetical protein
MITIETEGNIAYLIAEGELTKQDYDKLIPAMEALIFDHKIIRLYFELQDFHGWELSALWEDLKFDFKHRNDFSRVAVVGDKQWEKWLTNLSKPFTKAAVKYFDLHEKEAAKRWIEE